MVAGVMLHSLISSGVTSCMIVASYMSKAKPSMQIAQTVRLYAVHWSAASRGVTISLGDRLAIVSPQEPSFSAEGGEDSRWTRRIRSPYVLREALCHLCANMFFLYSLEPDIRWREAEFGATEYRGGALGVVASMRPHGVHIAPGSLDRIIEKDAAPAARLEQAIDGAHAPIDPLAGVPPVAGTPGQRDCLAGAGDTHHLGKVAEQPVARAAHLGGRFRQAKLDERVLDDARLVTQIDAPTRL